MAKKKVKRKPVGGPFLAAAVFCDNILQGADGALSAIRIVDQVNAAISSNAPPDIPSESRKLPVAIWTLLMFKSGSAKGEHEIRLTVHSPSGKRTPGLKQKVVFSDGPSGGANLKLHLGLAIAECGQYIVDVLLDGKRITRMPLVISVTREGSSPPKRAKKRATPKRKRVTPRKAAKK